ncbi:ABC transporter permease [Enterococcus faecium]|uniref:ABC transporter permease n=1 Tax=Enterococcus faecium TaxID=1352 RepID=UPI00298C5A41|nr:ABC transporter permease [Enterococcus faecium]
MFTCIYDFFWNHGNSINLLGTKIADEKKQNWYIFIKTSVVDTKLYGISHIFSYLLISLVFTVTMFIVAFLVNDVSLPFFMMTNLVMSSLLGSIPFLILALIIGEFGSAAQPIGTILYLFLSFLGGLWMPIDAMPETMRKIAKYLPSYLYADNGWKILANKSFSFNNVIGLVVWSTIFLIIYFLTQTIRKKN